MVVLRALLSAWGDFTIYFSLAAGASLPLGFEPVCWFGDRPAGKVANTPLSHQGQPLPWRYKYIQ